MGEFYLCGIHSQHEKEKDILDLPEKYLSTYVPLCIYFLTLLSPMCLIDRERCFLQECASRLSTLDWESLGVVLMLKNPL